LNSVTTRIHIFAMPVLRYSVAQQLCRNFSGRGRQYSRTKSGRY